MKKREEKSIIIGFILAITIFLGFCLYLIYYLYPSFIEIENLKQEYKKNLEDINNIEYKGIKYENYLKLKNSYKGDEFEGLFDERYKNMIKKMDANFYNTTLGNSIDSSNDFIKSLEKINENILIEKNSSKYKEQLKFISNILPKYSEYIEGKGFLTNFKFINYLENLLNKYNLITNNKIGIKTVILEENTDNIYYIPINLELVGTKGDIINFLNDIKESGKIILNNGKIEIINGANNLAEIEKIELDNYLTIPNKSRQKTESLVDFLDRTNQIDDYIKTNILIKFYVNGISKDVILKNINKVIGNIKSEILYDENGNVVRNKKGALEYKIINYNYLNLLAFAKKLNLNPIINKNNYYKNKVLKVYNYLNDAKLKKDIEKIKKSLNKVKDLNSTYKRVLKYKEIFSNLDRELYEVTKAMKLEKILPTNYYPQK